MKTFSFLFSFYFFVSFGFPPCLDASLPSRRNPRGSFSLKNIEIPNHAAILVQSHVPDNSSRSVFIVQDLHEKMEAQINLAEIIRGVRVQAENNNKQLIVAVEGATGVIDAESVSRFFDHKTKEGVAASLLRSGYLFGEEYAALLANSGALKITGIEKADLYLKNIQARDSSYRSRTRILKGLGLVKKQLEMFIDHNFNAAFASIEKDRLKMMRGDIRLGTYISALQRFDEKLFASYPELVHTLKLIETEQAFNFELVNKSRDELIRKLVQMKPKEETEALAKRSTAFAEGRLSALSYYSSLQAMGGEESPEMTAYVQYLKKAERVNSERLFKEMSHLEFEIGKKSLKHSAAKSLYDSVRWIENQEHFLSLSLLPEEWEAERKATAATFLERWKNIQNFINEQIEDVGCDIAVVPLSLRDARIAVQGARDFYSLAEARTGALSENLINLIHNPSAAGIEVVLVTGGFHAPAIAEYLNNRNLGTVILQPHVHTGIVLPKGPDYPSYLLSKQENSLKETNFLRPEGGLSAVGGTQFVTELMKSPGIFPKAGWPKKYGSLRNNLDETEGVQKYFKWIWKWVSTALPIFKILEQPDVISADSYVSQTVDSLTRIVGGQAQKFSMELSRIMAEGLPRSAQDPSYVLVDLDTLGLGKFLAQGDSWVELFLSLNAKTTQTSSPGGEVVFFSRNSVLNPRLDSLLRSANSRAVGIRFSYIGSIAETDVRRILIASRIPEANISSQNTFALTAEGREFENAQNIFVEGIPHLALAAFAYSHYREGNAVLDRLVRLFELLTPLRMSGSLTERIMAEVLAKISA